jgi:hypothetical protein
MARISHMCGSSARERDHRHGLALHSLPVHRLRQLRETQIRTSTCLSPIEQCGRSKCVFRPPAQEWGGVGVLGSGSAEGRYEQENHPGTEVQLLYSLKVSNPSTTPSERKSYPLYTSGRYKPHSGKQLIRDAILHDNNLLRVGNCLRICI